MNPYVTILPAFGAVLLDLSFAPGATVLGARPSVTLVTVCLWAALRPQTEAMFLAPAAGLLLGLLGNEPLGVSILAFAPLVVLGSLQRGGPVERRLLFSVALAAAGTLVYIVAFTVLARVAGSPASLSLSALPVIAATTALNCALAALLFWPLILTVDGKPIRNDLVR